jgi:hypothetical protein
MLSSNYQGIFQMLNLENDKIDNKNETFESEELQAFLSISRNLDSGGVTGAEYYPGELIAPIRKDVKLSENQLDLLIEYYNRAYVDYNFSRPRLNPSSSSENYIAVTGKITDYASERNILDLYYPKDISEAPTLWHVL